MENLAGLLDRALGSILQITLLTGTIGVLATLGGAPLGPEIAVWSGLAFAAAAAVRGLVALFGLLE